MPLAPRAAAAPASAGRDRLASVKLWPGTVTPQPKPFDWKRANAIALSTGLAPWMRVTFPSFPRSRTTDSPITDDGPRTQMLGFWCWISAWRVGGGIPFFRTKSTASPARAAPPRAPRAGGGGGGGGRVLAGGAPLARRRLPLRDREEVVHRGRLG